MTSSWFVFFSYHKMHGPINIRLTKLLFVSMKSDRNPSITWFKHTKRNRVIHITDKFRDHSRLFVIYSDRRRLASAVCTEHRICKYTWKIMLLHPQLRMFTFRNVLSVTDTAVKLQINADHTWKLLTFRRCLAYTQTYAFNAKSKIY